MVVTCEPPLQASPLTRIQQPPCRPAETQRRDTGSGYQQRKTGVQQRLGVRAAPDVGCSALARQPSVRCVLLTVLIPLRKHGAAMLARWKGSSSPTNGDSELLGLYNGNKRRRPMSLHIHITRIVWRTRFGAVRSGTWGRTAVAKLYSQRLRRLTGLRTHPTRPWQPEICAFPGYPA